MWTGGLNRTQRIVVILGLGAGLYAFGGWVTTRGSLGGSGWVAYAPLSDATGPLIGVSGLHPWVRLLVWLGLIIVWVIASLWLLRSSAGTGGEGATD